uniref:tRNA/rRNA methyltransferase SpoU type domain-containing protein n=1 Tax=Zonotrichia albicollis TaxID=44394 RepID=A0A8D2QIB0_ZONAL
MVEGSSKYRGMVGHEDEEGAAIPVQHYYEDWAKAPVAVVVGGETQGLSPAALGLAASTGGRRLLIPVVPGVDSLNSAIAAGILLFEGRRQLLCRHKQEDASGLSRQQSQHGSSTPSHCPTLPVPLPPSGFSISEQILC